LDGYNKRLRLAFEHQGRQHNEFLKKYFGTNRKLFERRLQLDRRKKILCRKMNVRLICVPQLSTHLDLEDLKDFIIKRCLLLGVPLPKDSTKKEIDYSAAFRPAKIDWITRLKEYCREKKGVCLSKAWLGWKIKYSFRCNRGHLWKTTPQSLLRYKSWCRRCHLKDTNFLKTTPEQARTFARKKGGDFLDYRKAYKGSNHRYWWKCSKGHKWKTTFCHLKSGTWCPYCAGNRRLPLSYTK